MQYLRRSPEVLHLRVGYGLPERRPGAHEASRRGAAPTLAAADAARAWVAVAELEWSAADDAGAALRKLRQLQASICADQPKEEEVVAELTVGGAEARSGRVHDDGDGDDDGDRGKNDAVAAQPAVRLRLSVRVPQVTALKMELSRVTGSAGSALSPSVAEVVGGGCELETVHTLKAGEGFLPFVLDALPRWAHLRRLHLSGAGLTSLPDSLLPGLPSLQELHVDHNRLTALPPLHAVAASLRVLCADHNAIAALPAGLAACTRLRCLTLEANRLERPIVDLRPLGGSLEELRLGGNALDYLPEMSYCTRLRTLSLANARITADALLRRVDVADCGDAAAAGEDGSGDGGVSVSLARESTASALLGRGGGARRDFSALYALIFRYSSCQLPLLACAVARLASESDTQAEAIAAAEGGVQQLLSMVLSDNPVVVGAACRTLAALAEQPPLAAKLFDARAVARMLALLRRGGPPAGRCSALRVLAALAWASGGVAATHLAAPELLAALRSACCSRSEAVRRCALRALGNVALTPPAARALLAAPGLRAFLARIATGAPPDHGDVSDDDDVAPDAPRPPRARPSAAVRRRATRALAILGENELVAAAVGRPFILAPRRGLRILAMDGGGMRGLATVRILRRIEALTGRRIADLFDMICGTSTGAVLAVALGVHCQELDVCEALYRHLGAAVFAPRGGGRDESGFAQRLTQLYSSTSSRVRVAVSGCKHDAERFEAMVRETAAFPAAAGSEDSDEESEPALIDTAVLGGPAVFAVATLMTVTPCVPFIFRNYTHPARDGDAGSDAAEEEEEAKPHEPGAGGSQLPPLLGSCKHRLWHALRASSAAPYYLADFAHGGLRWQDGALVANNPSLLALSEAAQRWPGVPIDMLVSLGSGATPPRPRDASAISRYIDAGAVLVEAATDVTRAADALALLAPAAGLSYHRFNPVDERCAVELDDLEDGLLADLEAATDEYCYREARRLEACAAQLLRGVAGGDGPRQEGPPRLRRRPEPPVPPVLVEATAAVKKARRKAAPPATHAAAPALPLPREDASTPPAPAPLPLTGGGARRRLGAARDVARGVLILDAPRAPPGAPSAELDTACDGAATPSPHAAAVAAAASRAGREAECRNTASESLSSPEACGLLAAALRRCAVVHCAARCDAAGLALRWRRDVTAVAEPGDAAHAFLATVSPHWAAPHAAAASHGAPAPAPPPSLRALCAAGLTFEAGGGVLHSPLAESASPSGANGTRVFSALFALLPPAAALSADDVYASLQGAPRGATFAFAHPPPLALAAALLDVGAAAVLAPALFTLPLAQASPPRAAVATAIAASSSPVTPKLRSGGGAAVALMTAPPPPDEAALTRFFDAFYSALLGVRRAYTPGASDDDDGEDASSYGGELGGETDAAERAALALGIAAGAEPAVAERFRVLTLRSGELFALRGSASAPAPAERMRHPAAAAEAASAAAAVGYTPPMSPALLMSPRATEQPPPPPWASPARVSSFRQAQAQQAVPAAQAQPPPSSARASVTGAAWAMGALGLGSPDGAAASSWWPSSTPPRR